MASTDIQSVPTLKSLCDTLAGACGATYIAAAEQPLALCSPVIYFHVPAGHERKRSAREILDEHFDGDRVVRHEAHTMRVDLRHVTHGEAHAFGRVPLYVQGHPGLDDVSFDEGLEAAHRYVAGEVELTRPPSDTIELGQLVERLADAGATAVELRNTPLIEWGIVDLRVPMTPAEGHEVAGPYTAVTAGDDEYHLRIDFTLDGPGGYGAMRTPLFIGEGTLGLTSVSPEQGMGHFETVQEIAEMADDDAAARRALRELDFDVRPQET